VHSRGALGVQKDASVRDILGRASPQVNPQSVPPFPVSVQTRFRRPIGKLFHTFPVWGCLKRENFAPPAALCN